MCPVITERVSQPNNESVRMRYELRMYVKGICPDDGTKAPLGVAACVIKGANDPETTWTCVLRPSSPPLTENVAAIKAIFVALDQGWERWTRLPTHALTNLKPRMDVQIYTDSVHAFEFMTDVKRGRYDKDIFKSYDDTVGYAHELHDRLHEKGGVRYELISSAANKFACDAADNCLEVMRQEALGYGTAVKVLERSME